MKIFKTKLFQNGRINFYVKYKQFQEKVTDSVTGEETLKLFHAEEVYYLGLPFLVGYTEQCGQCDDTADYYRQ